MLILSVIYLKGHYRKEPTTTRLAPLNISQNKSLEQYSDLPSKRKITNDHTNEPLIKHSHYHSGIDASIREYAAPKDDIERINLFSKMACAARMELFRANHLLMKYKLKEKSSTIDVLKETFKENHEKYTNPVQQMKKYALSPDT